MQAERSFTDASLADTAKLQDTLFKELRGRIQESDETVPIRCDNWKEKEKSVWGGAKIV